MLYRNTQQDLLDILTPFCHFDARRNLIIFIIQRTISLLLNKDSKPTTQLFCVVKITCGSNRIRTYSVKRQRFYRPPQLSYFGVLPFCLGNRTRTCNLLHPKQANNQSLSSQILLNKVRLIRGSNPFLPRDSRESR